MCADAVVRSLKGLESNLSPATNSACYTPITMSTASWFSLVCGYADLRKTMKPVGGAPTESASISHDQYQEMEKWFDSLMRETFS